jgi:hypothetical protein
MKARSRPADVPGRGEPAAEPRDSRGAAASPAGALSPVDGGSGFLRKLGDLFLGSFDPQKEKRRLLKAIARSLRKAGARYYNPKNERVEPDLAALLLQFHAVLGPAQRLLEHARSSKVLKAIVIESGLSQEQIALKERLTEESLVGRARTTPYAQLVQEAKQDLKAFFACFDANRTREINQVYADLNTLLTLVQFDYHYLLRKFDPQFPEANPDYVPHFESCNSEYVREELKELLDVLLRFDPAQSWSTQLDILKVYRGVEVVSREGWRKLLQLIRKLRRTREIEMLVQLVSQDPFYKSAPGQGRENVVDEFLSKTRTQIEAAMQKISKEKRSGQIQALLRQLFGGLSYTRLENYTEAANEQFTKKGMQGFAYSLPLNCLHSFLKDFVQIELRQLVDLLLIPAKWTDNAPSRMLSESFHQLNGLLPEVEEFDGSLSVDSEMGRRLASMAARADKSAQTSYMAGRLLKNVNDSARGLLVRACQHVIVLGKVLKQIFEDSARSSPKMILNWGELAGRAKRDLRQMFATDYQKLFNFLQLVKLYV